jgi:hypothetical protein
MAVEVTCAIALKQDSRPNDSAKCNKGKIVLRLGMVIRSGSYAQIFCSAMLSAGFHMRLLQIIRTFGRDILTCAEGRK